MLATARRIPEVKFQYENHFQLEQSAEAVKDGTWKNWRLDWMCGRDLFGATVGIVGNVTINPILFLFFRIGKNW
jgi:lactate dehydrogenase-like 2-hydroxyacid dehydrogenase